MIVTKHAGFTLIEVLIAVIILALGLLGLAGIQAKSLGNNQSAYNRSQATQLAYDIADRMRANPTVAGNYLTAFMKPTDASCATDDTPCSACTSAAKACTPAQLAESDLFQWNNELKAVFPNGDATITIDGVIYTVTISWDDDKDGDTEDVSFSMRFQL
jgi:type IV pilus assembly protein PilV